MKTFHGISFRNYGFEHYYWYHAILVYVLNYFMAWLGLFDAMVRVFSLGSRWSRTRYDFLIWLQEQERIWEKRHENNL